MSSAIRPQPRPVPLASVIPEAAVVVGGPAEDTLVTGITLDSRSVVRGDAYAALPGHLTHGARFAADAVAAGAVAVITDPEGLAACGDVGVPVVVVEGPRSALGGIAAHVYGDPASALQLLGVTGTNGKTTVAAMVESGLRSGGRTTGLIGTVGTRIAGHAHAGVRTTPEATDLQALLAVMREAGVDSVVMEVSSIALEEHRVDGVRYDVAAFTNLTQDHLDYHGSMEEYFAAKARLFTASRAGLGIVGIDDDWGRRLAAEAGVAVQTWSLLDQHADWHVVREGGALAVLGPGGERQPIVVPMPGAFNVANAVCAYAVLRGAGVPAPDAAAGIADVSVPGRMQVVAEVAGVRGIVDYAHSPDAVERVLRAARDETPGRVIAVVGAGGDRDRGKRPLMGRTAARLADVVVITDDNPRSEDPVAIRRAIRDGALQVAPGERAEVLEEGDRGAAVTVAVGLAEAGDVVLVLGKGHEQGQEVAGLVTPFDDASVLAAALRAGGAG
jgi:UDP-N-acetylmuramoyl-L-alanyl-D-glutamate--2,6-diaminopimelate ligase